jgi:hypothetical protein
MVSRVSMDVFQYSGCFYTVHTNTHTHTDKRRNHTYRDVYRHKQSTNKYVTLSGAPQLFTFWVQYKQLVLCVAHVPWDNKLMYFLYSKIFFLYVLLRKSRDSSVGIATSYGLDDRGVEVRVPVGSRIFSSPSSPDRLWGPLNLLSNWYRG